jgi:hypothetical protein
MIILCHGFGRHDQWRHQQQDTCCCQDMMKPMLAIKTLSRYQSRYTDENQGLDTAAVPAQRTLPEPVPLPAIRLYT